jgi:hypothetical protein
LAWLIKKNEKLLQGREWEKVIPWIIVRQKKSCTFWQKLLRKRYGKEQRQKEKQKGLIAKINANDLCQRKLF